MKREANINNKNRRLVLMSMMIAILAILSYTPIGMVPLPFASATTVHIPVIITAILEGPVAGLVLGLAMGIISMIRSLTPNGPLDMLFLNPAVSILPRLLIPLVAYYSFALINKVLGGLISKVSIVACLVAGALGSMTNTIGCLGMLYILYAKEVVEKLTAANGGELVQIESVLYAIIASSGVAEMIVAAVVTAVLVPVLRKTFY